MFRWLLWGSLRREHCRENNRENRGARVTTKHDE